MDERYEILLRNAYRLFNPTDSLNDSMRVGWHVEEYGVEFHGASDGDEVEFETPELAAAIGYALDEMAILRIRIADLENVTMSEQGIEAMGYMKLPTDRDGVPIRPGETVYGPCLSDEGENVLAVLSMGVLLGDTDQWGLHIDSGNLTHEPPQRYPLDAHGVECRVGDAGCWLDEPTVQVTIESVDSDEYAQLTVRDGRGRRNTICADEFTHTDPDSWDRLERDSWKTETDEYWGCEGASCNACPSKMGGKTPDKFYGCDGCLSAIRPDLVRRAEALAGATPKCSEATQKGGAE